MDSFVESVLSAENMYCISVSFKKAPLSIRQTFAFSVEEQKSFLSELWQSEKITGGVVVSTCNRSEIYVTGEKDALEAVENMLVRQKSISKESIKTYCLYYSGTPSFPCCLWSGLHGAWRG
jgi:glutamyl-tRNA reductase